MAKIFISYRRADSATFSGRIYDRLIARFGRRQVFKDVDDIPAGAKFAQYIQDALRDCAVALVVIGPGWLDARDTQGRRRLDDPADYVRLEIETALNLGLTVIPLLVDGARMPGGDEAPEALRPLAQLNALPVRNDPDFARDMERAIEGVERGLASRRSEAGWFGRRSPSAPRPEQTPPPSTAPKRERQQAERASQSRRSTTSPTVAPTKSAPYPSASRGEERRPAVDLTRVRRPVIAGLAVVVVVASFAALLSLGPGRALFAGANGHKLSGTPGVAATATLTSTQATQTRVADITMHSDEEAAPDCAQDKLDKWTLTNKGLTCLANPAGAKLVDSFITFSSAAITPTFHFQVTLQWLSQAESATISVCWPKKHWPGSSR